MRSFVKRICLVTLIALAACAVQSEELPSPEGKPHRIQATESRTVATSVVQEAARTAPHSNVVPTQALKGGQLDGSSFPDRVLALTWDDGPDRHSLELARYLHSERVSATFFVVQAWSREVSSYPGYGETVQNTGYEQIPILQALVGLGHRVANHTEHHVFLDRVDAEHARNELLVEQRNLAPFEQDELHLFRAPGGAWSDTIAAEENEAPELRRMVGPVRWDIDRKDWESSIRCDSKRPAVECEAWRGGLRLKPAVTASRYFDSISKTPRGIVLLHDRVADVGSRYALDVAHALVPRLIERGFVFAAPVLAFSPLSDRLTDGAAVTLKATETQRWRFYDENRDGRADLCVQDASGWSCMPSVETRQSASDRSPKSVFEAPVRPRNTPEETDSDASECARQMGVTAHPADIDADGHDECCALTPEGIACEAGRGSRPASPTGWSADPIFRSAFLRRSTLLVGDLNGDRRADVCVLDDGAVECAFSTGSSFTRPTIWAQPGTIPRGSWLALADVNGDSRADLCVVEKGRVSCGLAP